MSTPPSTVAFRVSDFFDARDLVQVKYEMLRRVRVERTPVTRAAECACAMLLYSVLRNSGYTRGRVTAWRVSTKDPVTGWRQRRVRCPAGGISVLGTPVASL